MPDWTLGGTRAFHPAPAVPPGRAQAYLPHKRRPGCSREKDQYFSLARRSPAWDGVAPVPDLQHFMPVAPHGRLGIVPLQHAIIVSGSTMVAGGCRKVCRRDKQFPIAALTWRPASAAPVSGTAAITYGAPSPCATLHRARDCMGTRGTGVAVQIGSCQERLCRLGPRHAVVAGHLIERLPADTYRPGLDGVWD